ncbi:MAG TPA: RagB/SusD family nutrient uptake outer membrane protein [Sphingobacteriaceae bacterium]|nr:RagB/SusD family nutrient uptake outer membrane protein [Sphingobacteriaceae bacterium]
MKTFFLKPYYFLLTAIVILAGSCELDTVNPNAPSDDQVLSTRDGIIALSVGVRQFYSTSGLDAILSTAVTGRELKGISTFTNVLELEAGSTALPTFNSNILNLWGRMQRVMTMSEDILQNAPNISSLSGGTLSGVTAHAQLFKAIALGTLATAFEQNNIQTSKAGGTTFVPRQQVLQEAIRLLDNAIAVITATPVSSEFNTLVTGPSFDLRNTLFAYNARYNLMAGNYAKAIENADKVDLTRKSEFIYSSQSPNPVYNIVFILKNFGARDNFGLPAGLFETGDRRYDFYLTTPNSSVNGDPLKTLKGFFDSQTAPIPVYLPDEMRLIKAEAILRNNGLLTDALVLINAVRTQTTGDPFNVYAALPPYTGAVTKDALLLEVYKQRSAELYLSGQKWEDSRRFGRPAPPASTAERNRNFYPYPDQERLNNPNIPGDPAI